KNTGSTTAQYAARTIGEPALTGIGEVWGRSSTTLGEKLAATVGAAIGSAAKATQALIDKITKAREDSDNAAAVRSAQAALKAAIKAGEGVADARRALNQALEAITLTGLNRRLALQLTADAKEQAAADRAKAAAEKTAAARLAMIEKSMARVKALAEKAASAASAAWDAVQNKILSAFDMVTGAFKSPARQELDLIAARRKQEDVTLAVSDAEKALNDARQTDGLDAARAAIKAAKEKGEGVSDAERAYQQAAIDRDAAILSAERTLARAREDVVINSLELQAAEQEKAWADQREGEKTQLETTLTNVGAHLTKVGAAWDKGLAEVIKIMAAFGIPFETAGATLGTAFATALGEQMDAAARAAERVLETIQATMRAATEAATVIRAAAQGVVLTPSAGATRASELFPRRRMARGGIVTSPTMALIGESGPEAVIPLSGGGGGVGGNVTLVVNMPNYLGSRQRAAQEIYDEFVALSRRQGALFSRTVGATA
ncbi:MAG: hypothetical protein NUW01_15225, partial [Gemmatimonadaceae bacterium]|nr:hypothetical protein [Gemmatimonadaceae bacterium]